jgi:23S rRNA (uracil1939-C5)-methyltransferase
MPPSLYPAAIQPQDRATPPCPHFGSCGGCQLQHLTYAAQLRDKAIQFRTRLEAPGLAPPTLQLHPSPPLAYRNRIRLTLVEIDGQLRAGYLRSLSHHGAGCPTSGFSDVGLGGVEGLNSLATKSIPTFLPITECPIAAPILWRAAEALLKQINVQPTLWLRNPQLALDQLEIFTTAEESGLQFTLFLRTGLKALPKKLANDFTTLCESLRIALPELTGAGIATLPTVSKDRSRRNEQPRPGPTWGKPGLTYRVAEIDYWVPRTAFFQVNRFLLPELLALVTNNRTGRLAFDLYAGVGLFSRALSAHFAQVTAVEIAEPTATALTSTKLPNLHAVKATTLDFLRAAVTDRDRPDLIVLDPPRSGAGTEVCSLLARISAPTLVYVSCSPEALPADLATLVASGYTLAELHLFDLFPQTTHIETVAVLTR